MSEARTHRFSERRERLWVLAVPPGIWVVRFLLAYATAAIFCAKWGGTDASFDLVRWVLAGYSAAALLGLGATGWSAYRRHQAEGEPLPHDADSPGDRHRFLGFATLLLTGLSAIAVVFETLPVLFIGSCR